MSLEVDARQDDHPRRRIHSRLTTLSPRSDIICGHILAADCRGHGNSYVRTATIALPNDQIPTRTIGGVHRTRRATRRTHGPSDLSSGAGPKHLRRSRHRRPSRLPLLQKHPAARGIPRRPALGSVHRLALQSLPARRVHPRAVRLSWALGGGSWPSGTACTPRRPGTPPGPASAR